MKGQYCLSSTWNADGLTPDSIAARSLLMLDELAAAAPTLCEWQFVDESLDGPDPDDDDLDEIDLDELESQLSVSMARFRANAARLLASWVAGDERGDPKPPSGYHLLALDQRANEEKRYSQDTHISLQAGSTYSNYIDLRWGDMKNGTDARVISYDRCRQALETMIDAWPCPWASVHFSAFDETPPHAPILTPEDLQRYIEGPSDYPPLLHWIIYLSAPLARKATATGGLITEATPGGGVFLSVTKDRFDPTDPDHRRGAAGLSEVLDRCLGPGGTNNPPPAPRVGPF